MGLPIIPQALCALGPWEHEFEWQSAKETENGVVKKAKMSVWIYNIKKQNSVKYYF